MRQCCAACDGCFSLLGCFSCEVLVSACGCDACCPRSLCYTVSDDASRAVGDDDADALRAALQRGADANHRPQVRAAAWRAPPAQRCASHSHAASATASGIGTRRERRHALARCGARGGAQDRVRGGAAGLRRGRERAGRQGTRLAAHAFRQNGVVSSRPFAVYSGGARRCTRRLRAEASPASRCCCSEARTLRPETRCVSLPAGWLLRQLRAHHAAHSRPALGVASRSAAARRCSSPREANAARRGAPAC